MNKPQKIQAVKASSTKTSIKLPKTRSFIYDIMKQGKRKNIVYLSFSIDITEVINSLKRYNSAGSDHISLTSYLIYCMARSIADNKMIQGIKKRPNGRKIVVFDDVDVAIMIERELDGALQPVNYIIRKADKKPISAIQDEINHARTEPLGQNWAMNSDEWFFWHLPALLRNIFWFLSKISPRLWKKFVGTAGFTNIGMLGEGENYAYPITPMTITLAVGTISEENELKTGGSVEPIKKLHLTLCADHDIVDGAPMMRFIEDFKKQLIANLKILSKSPIGISTIQKRVEEMG